MFSEMGKEQTDSRVGARNYIGMVEAAEEQGYAKLRDKTGEKRFFIMADVLEEFAGRRVQITITPLTDGEPAATVSVDPGYFVR